MIYGSLKLNKLFDLLHFEQEKQANMDINVIVHPQFKIR